MPNRRSPFDQPCDFRHLRHAGLPLPAIFEKVPGPLREDWVSAEPNRPLDPPAVRQPLKIPQPPDRASSIRFLTDVALGPEEVRHGKNSAPDDLPARLEFRPWSPR
jgi:hypothetical protein